MKKLIEIDPFKVNKLLNENQKSLMDKMNNARADEINKLIEENIPKWKQFFIKKSRFFNKFFKVFTTIEPVPLLESDLIHEKLILCVGKPGDHKMIAEADFRIQDQRKIDKRTNTNASYIPGKFKSLKQSEKNFDLSMGENPHTVTFHMYVEPTLINRVRYWLFCKFFPFKVTKWDKNIIKKKEEQNNGTKKKI